MRNVTVRVPTTVGPNNIPKQTGGTTRADKAAAAIAAMKVRPQASSRAGAVAMDAISQMIENKNLGVTQAKKAAAPEHTMEKLRELHGEVVDEVEKWLDSGDAGISSKTICCAMLETAWTTLDSNFGPSVPKDADDFGRCCNLLTFVAPDWRNNLEQVSAYYPSWIKLVREWDELESLWDRYEYGCGEDAEKCRVELNAAIKKATTFPKSPSASSVLPPALPTHLL